MVALNPEAGGLSNAHRSGEMLGRKRRLNRLVAVERYLAAK
jgi:hypothetical protein